MICLVKSFIVITPLSAIDFTTVSTYAIGFTSSTKQCENIPSIVSFEKLYFSNQNIIFLYHSAFIFPEKYIDSIAVIIFSLPLFFF